MMSTIIYPTGSTARPVTPLVLQAYAAAAGEINTPFDYASEAAFPPINAGLGDKDSGASGTIQRVAADEMIKAPALIPRAPSADIEAIEGVQLDPITFQADELSLMVNVPSRAHHDTQGINLYGANISKVWHVLKLLQEIDFDTFLMAGTWHPDDGNTAAKWNTSTGDPLGDISTAVGKVPGANLIVMNREVLFAMGKNAVVRTNSDNTSNRNFITPAGLAGMLKDFFGLKLVVSGARKSVSGTESYVLRDSVWIGRAADAATEVGPREFKLNRQGAVRMGVQLLPTAADGRSDVKASYLPSIILDKDGNPMGGAPTLWLMEEWSEPRTRGRAGSIGHMEKLVQTSAVGGWVIGDVL